MSVFSVPITIGVDEERIAQEIHKNVENRVVDNIINEVKRVICGVSYYDKKIIENDLSPLRDLVQRTVDKTIEKYEDAIIEGAIDRLADRLSRRKVVAQKLQETIEE
jgi:hypothetical protein